MFPCRLPVVFAFGGLLLLAGAPARGGDGGGSGYRSRPSSKSPTKPPKLTSTEAIARVRERLVRLRREIEE